MTPAAPILIASYYFPPAGGAGTQRFAKFSKYLPNHGYSPVVLASDAGPGTPEIPHLDPAMLEANCRDTIVHRVVADDEASRRSFGPRLRRAAGLATDLDGWVRRAIPEAISVARETGAQAIVTTVSPFAVAEIGPRVRAALDIPWILDLRDPWALDGWRTHRTRFGLRRDLARMTRALRDADAVVANTPAARRRFVEHHGADPSRTWTIPNGWDPVDLATARAGLAGANFAHRFRVVHAGTLHDPSPPPASAHSGRDIDRAGRSGRALLEAVAELRRRRPDVGSDIDLRLVGAVHPDHRRLARELGVGDAFHEIGSLPHHATLAHVVNADAVFVPLHGVRDPAPPLVVPAKLYEAIASGRFVIGAVPEGDGARLLRLTGAGAVCPPADHGTIADLLVTLVEAWRRDEPRRGADPSVMAPFSRASLTRRLAAVLDDVLRGASSDPSDDPWLEMARTVRRGAARPPVARAA